MTAPERIGPYLVIHALGVGGIGEVFLAQRDGDPRLCALKRLKAARVQQGSSRARILREANVAAQLDHPNIAKVIGAGEEDGAFCIASEYVPGTDLFRILGELKKRNEVLGHRYCMTIARSVLEALEHAHDAKDSRGAPLELVHRDLSLKNVMISFAGQVKVIDFGVARANVDEFRTQAGVVVGSPNFTSPEQAVGDPIDRRSDIYSLSAVMFEMFTGRRLAGGPSAAIVLQKVVEEAAPRPTMINPALPVALDRVLLTGLAKSPAERWPDARSYLDALLPIEEEAGAATREELGAFVRGLFPEQEAQAAQWIAEAHARFTTSLSEASELNASTRAEFWEKTLVATRLMPSQAFSPPRTKRSVALIAGLALATSLVLVALTTARSPEPAPSAPIATPPPPPIEIVAPRASARSVIAEEEPPPVAIDEPQRIVPAKKKGRPPTERLPDPVPPPRSELDAKVDRLKLANAGADDPEVQDLVAELGRRAQKNAAAQVELRRVSLCLVDRSCGPDRLYPALERVVRALGPGAL